MAMGYNHTHIGVSKMKFFTDETQSSTSFSSLVFNQRDDMCLSSVQKHNKPVQHPNAKVVVVEKYLKRLPACPC